MRQYIIAAIIILLSACNNSNSKKINTQISQAKEIPDFFPVTAYIKGQIYEILQKGLTPLKYTIINNHTDSVLIKLEDLNTVLNEFLHPVIDSNNLTTMFTETKFLDQTINAFTFTYDPKLQLPDSLQLKHWDVYIDPETGKVKRIYIIKKSGENKMIQLTWLSNQWCNTTTIINYPDGTSKIEKEEKISWDY